MTFNVVSFTSQVMSNKGFHNITSICNHFNFDPTIKIQNGCVYNIYIICPYNLESLSDAKRPILLVPCHVQNK
jgi:hypothetical protein